MKTKSVRGPARAVACVVRCAARCAARSAVRRVVCVSVEPLEGRALFAATGLSRTDDITWLKPHRGTSSVPYGAKTPAQVRQAYGLGSLAFNGAAADGSGQTIAVLDAYDYPTALNDLNAFSAKFGLPTFNTGSGAPTFTKVGQTGSTGDLPGEDPSGPGDSWAVEAALDIEWAHAIAPKADIVLVEADGTSSDDLISAAAGYARSAPGVSVVSMSFGGDEDSRDAAYYDSVFTTPSGHQGVTFVASTGDDGAPGGYPAYSANVVAVGGTGLNLNSANGYASEYAWDGSGGGISSYTAQPSYQKGVVTQSTTKRTIPDVSWLADPSTGVAVYDSYDFGTSTPWLYGYEGGTSLAAPMWAGLFAVADQGRVLNGLGTFDGRTGALPALYSVPQSDFHDVATGGNGTYTAVSGYDLVTGRGTPTASLITDLANYGKTVTPPVATNNASVGGLTFNDTNGNGTQDSGEAVGSGKTIFLDTNNNGVVDSGEKSVVTGSNGTFAFSGLAAGTYHVRRVFPSGYAQSTATLDVTLKAGQAVTGLKIGSKAAGTTPPAATASLSGFAFDDKNKNGVYDTGETKTAGKTIFLDTDNDGVLDAGEKSVVTGTNGVFSFTGLVAGTYHIARVFPRGYVLSTPARTLTLTTGQALTGVTIGSKKA